MQELALGAQVVCPMYLHTHSHLIGLYLHRHHLPLGLVWFCGVFVLGQWPHHHINCILDPSLQPLCCLVVALSYLCYNRCEVLGELWGTVHSTRLSIHTLFTGPPWVHSNERNSKDMGCNCKMSEIDQPDDLLLCTTKSSYSFDHIVYVHSGSILKYGGLRKFQIARLIDCTFQIKFLFKVKVHCGDCISTG